MKKIVLSLSVIFVSFINFSQIQFALNGSCGNQGVYAMSWADQDFWEGSGGTQTWNTPNLLDPNNSVSGNLVIVEGINSDSLDDCSIDYACSTSAISNTSALNGNIAVVRRGQCEFSDKALAVQQAGAIACIIINADSTNNGLISMGGGIYGPNVFIPTILVNALTGIAICNAISQGCDQGYIGDPLLLNAYNNISGTVLYDINNDNCATSNLNLLTLYPTLITDGIDNYINISTDSLSYSTYVELGNYTTTVINLPGYLDANPNVDNVGFSTYGNSHIANFCITPNQSINDVAINFIPPTAIPGFNGTALIHYQNIGTTVQNGTITLNFDDSKLDFISSNFPTSTQTTGQITFSYANLQPFESRTISLELYAENPPINVIGDTLDFTGQITPITGDNNVSDNTFNVNTIVIGSYDPNDITVIEGEYLDISESDEFLTYLIRFQNTGTAPAVNVNVKQSMDIKLNPQSIQILESSHTMSVSSSNENFTFSFSNIFLPDSTANEPESHGYIIYKIKPQPNIVLGDNIQGTANIYFDFNPPITTNTASTTYIDITTLNISDIEKNLISIYPNPVKNQMNLTANTPILSIKIYNQLGQEILTQYNQNKVNVSDLKKGVYFCRIETDHNEISVIKFLKE